MSWDRQALPYKCNKSALVSLALSVIAGRGSYSCTMMIMNEFFYKMMNPEHLARLFLQSMTGKQYNISKYCCIRRPVPVQDFNTSQCMWREQVELYIHLVSIIYAYTSAYQCKHKDGVINTVFTLIFTIIQHTIMSKYVLKQCPSLVFYNIMCICCMFLQSTNNIVYLIHLNNIIINI